MKKRLLLMIIIVLTFINTSFATQEMNFNYIHLYEDNQSETNKVSYELIYPEETEYIFEMNLIFNNEKLKENCLKNIQLEENTIFSKITCEIPKLGDGEYTFEGYFYDKNKNLIKKTIDKEFIAENTNAKMQFFTNGNKTTISIEIKGNQPVTVLNEIPKEVIPSLTPENKESLIDTNSTYIILEEDPLIAWNIEEPPRKINYTINKKISIEDQKKFQLEIKNDSTFKGLKYSIFVIILIILGFLIKPALKKKK